MPHITDCFQDSRKKNYLNTMEKENQNNQSKMKALKYVMDKIYTMEIFPKKSFNKFRNENIYFLSEMNIKQQKFEFECFCFYEVCQKIHLNVTTSEIRSFFLTYEGTKKGTTND